MSRSSCMSRNVEEMNTRMSRSVDCEDRSISSPVSLFPNRWSSNPVRRAEREARCESKLQLSQLVNWGNLLRNCCEIANHSQYQRAEPTGSIPYLVTLAE